MINRSSILINSCDKYSDIWEPFFYLFKKMWNGVYPNIYLNSEYKKYEDADIPIINLNKGNKLEWGGRLLECLKDIETPYVLMMLEDFFYEKPINVKIVEQCVDYLDANPDIMAFQFVPSGEVLEENYLENEDFPKFIRRKKFGMFTVIAGPTLWRKKDLVNITCPKDTPWAWEYFGSIRTWFYGKKIYSWKSMGDCIFKYDLEHGGAVHRGKWVGYKTREIENKFGFSIDYGDREIEYDWMKSHDFNQIPPFYKRIKSIINNRMKMIKELIYGFYLRITNGIRVNE